MRFSPTDKALIGSDLYQQRLTIPFESGRTGVVQPIADPHPVAHRAHRRHLYEFIRRQCTDRRTRHHGFDRGDLQRADAA